jgi:hypothetical protein
MTLNYVQILVTRAIGESSRATDTNVVDTDNRVKIVREQPDWFRRRYASRFRKARRSRNSSLESHHQQKRGAAE